MDLPIARALIAPWGAALLRRRAGTTESPVAPACGAGRPGFFMRLELDESAAPPKDE
jgi:hypothetical protein